jgi:hypothetical protein
MYNQLDDIFVNKIILSYIENENAIYWNTIVLMLDSHAIQ